MLLECIRELGSYEVRRRKPNIGKCMVDGEGAKRVINDLLSLVE